MYNNDLQFSLWADFIERDFIQSGLRKLIADGTVNGATSNPAIFKNAILTSAAYKEQIATLSSFDAKSKYEQIAIKDIQLAADELKPLYDRGDDGFVSIEIDPFLCDDAKASIDEGLRLYKTIDRENVMIKVPATSAGYEVMKALVAQGIHVNAFKSAKENVKSVISVFVSRIDRAIDATLEKAGVETFLTGVYNAAAIYNAIEAMNLPNTRTLFASTGVKGDGKEREYYIKALLAPKSVNTAPIETIKAFVNSAKSEARLPLAEDIISSHMAKVAQAGVDLDSVINQQIEDGLEAFKVAFKEILDALE